MDKILFCPSVTYWSSFIKIIRMAQHTEYNSNTIVIFNGFCVYLSPALHVSLVILAACGMRVLN